MEHLVQGVRTRTERKSPRYTARITPTMRHGPDTYTSVRGVKYLFRGISRQFGNAEALRGENCTREFASGAAPEPAVRADAPCRGRGFRPRWAPGDGIPSAQCERDEVKRFGLVGVVCSRNGGGDDKNPAPQKPRCGPAVNLPIFIY